MRDSYPSQVPLIAEPERRGRQDHNGAQMQREMCRDPGLLADNAGVEMVRRIPLPPEFVLG